MYDFLNKIGLKIMLEAVKAKFPETLPASGGNADHADNADKLDGLHAAAFLQNVVPVNLTTSINDMTTAGTYGVYSKTPDLPTGYGSWGFLEVRRFGLLCYQTIIFENGVIINRGIQTNGGDWSNWRCAYTNMSKPYVTGSISVSYSTSYHDFTILDFTPSAVICRFPAKYQNNGTIEWATPITNGFRIYISSAEVSTLDYIAFR